MNYYDDVLQTIKTRRHVAYSTNILEPGVGLFSNRFSQISTVLRVHTQFVELLQSDLHTRACFVV